MTRPNPAPRPNPRLAWTEANGSEISWLRWFWLPLAIALALVSWRACR